MDPGIYGNGHLFILMKKKKNPSYRLSRRCWPLFLFSILLNKSPETKHFSQFLKVELNPTVITLKLEGYLFFEDKHVFFYDTVQEFFKGRGNK